MTKHTPGPWVARESGTFNLPAYDIESTAPGRHLVTVLASSVNSSAEQDDRMKADAVLIAAAPELLEALLRMRDEVREFLPNVCGEALTQTEAAIRKARGETP